MSTWEGGAPPPERSFGVSDWLRIVGRGVPLGVTVFGGLLVLLALRLIERPLFGLHRPITPFVTQGVCIAAFFWMGIARRVEGTPMTDPGAAVANHASWLDIFTLNASKRVYFVSKAEVARWPGIGWLARATGTVFIERDRARAAEQTAMFEARLDAGHRLMFFPEGTSTDGQRVLSFKTTLFQAFFTDHLRPVMKVQPVTLRYLAPAGEDRRFYGWWGDMGFGPHLLQVLAAPRQGSVSVTYHPPIAVQDVPDRKSLALACEAAVRNGFETGA